MDRLQTFYNQRDTKIIPFHVIRKASAFTNRRAKSIREGRRKLVFKTLPSSPRLILALCALKKEMDSSKRRLPSWMLGTTAPDEASSLESRVISKDDDEEMPPVKPRRSRKPKLQVRQSPGKEDLQERESVKETSFSLKRCEGKRGKRKATSDNGHKSDDDLERNGHPMDEEECQNPRPGGGCEDYGLEEDADEAFVPRSKVQSKKSSKVARSCGSEPLEVNSCLLKK
ncbi:hypothetical protein AKJ16_DCAP07960, partial [Drosera capensis]